MNWPDLRYLFRLLADQPPVRRALAALVAARGRRHLAWLDRLGAGRAQVRTLLGLVHQARSTRFGRDHDFARIRTVADYRRLVPLRPAAEFSRDYPHAGDTWPSAGAPTFVPLGAGSARPLVLSAQLQRAHRRALQTALSLLVSARGQHGGLASGQVLWLGDDTSLLQGGEGGVAHDPERVACERLPWLVRPLARVGPTWDSAHGKHAGPVVPALVARLAHEPAALLVGPAERIAAFVEQVQRVRGLSIERLWPDLIGVVATRRDQASAMPALRHALGEGPAVVELLTLPGGPLAVEDARLGGLRFLPEHGSYLELVPSGDDTSAAPRFGVEEAEAGQSYEVVLTSPAGLWACRTGLYVRREEASAFALVAPPVRAAAALRSSSAPPPAGAVAPAGHPRSDGSQAATPGTHARMPWSALADRE